MREIDDISSLDVWKSLDIAFQKYAILCVGAFRVTAVKKDFCMHVWHVLARNGRMVVDVFLLCGFGPVRTSLQPATFTTAHETSLFGASVVSTYSGEEKGLSRLAPILIMLALVSEQDT
jgi:hypothetical protein